MFCKQLDECLLLRIPREDQIGMIQQRREQILCSFVGACVEKSRIGRVGSISDAIRPIMLENDIKVTNVGRLVLKELQRIPILVDPDNINVLEENIISQ
jgi:hypothetical protein